MSQDGHLGRVAAERRDVLADVVQCCDEVEQSVVAGRDVVAETEETCTDKLTRWI